MYGMNYLRRKLANHRMRVKTRYNYYDMKDTERKPSIVIPNRLRELYRATLGWSTQVVDSVGDRLEVYKFTNDTYGMSDIFEANNPEVLFDSGFTGALIAGCSFIYIHKEDGYPVMQVISADNATGVMNPVTRTLTEGYAVLDRDRYGNATLEAYFLPHVTWYYPKDEEPYAVEHAAPEPLLVPLVFKPDDHRPFGHSRISRAIMSAQDMAIRTLERSEVSSEFYSFPQRYVLGRDSDSDELDNYKAAVTLILELTKNEDGSNPTVGQWAQQSMAPFIEEVKLAASRIAGESGMTLEDLGFPVTTPTSSEQARAAHSQLQATIRRARRTLGAGFKSTGYLAACIRDDEAYSRKILPRTKILWEPNFEPDSASLSGIGDGVLKINQAIPGYIGSEEMRQLTGITGANRADNGEASQAPFLMPKPAEEAEDGE